ncbi:MAG: hypothetical protein HYT80_06875 [Euryarchaeota archaeon]|nr:hypothetical protein [Euryarchaeota archaeon]
MEPTAQAKKSWTPARKANVALGAIMVTMGVFLLLSISNDLEFYVLVSGPILMLAGLGAIMVMFVKDMPASATWLGGAAVALGAVLFVHDLVLPPAIANVAHAGSGLGVLLVGILQLVGTMDLAARFSRKKVATKP